MVKNEVELKEFLNQLKREDITFKKHFYDKQQDRQYLSEELIVKSLKDLGNILGIQDQSKDGIERYRIGIKLSSNYDLVVICEIKDKNLYITTAWKTSRKWQKSIQK